MTFRTHSLKMTVILTVTATLLLVWAGGALRRSSAAAQGACVVTPITIGEVVSGALATTDCRSPLRGTSYYADRYSFTGTTGMAIAIRTTSLNFDGYIYLIGPDGTTLASQDSENFPSSGGFFNLPASGTYTFEMTTFSTNQTGSYKFIVIIGTAGCSYSLSSTSQSLPATGGTGNISVTTSSPCLWTAVSDSDWITITSGGNTTGPGAVNYTVAANPTADPRSGSLIVAGQTVAVSQLGSTSTCLVAPTSIGQIVNGTISSGDCTSVVRGSSYLADRYSFSGTAGNGLAIICSSPDINLNLQLIGPNGLALLGNNSRLPSSGFFNLPATGMYILEVTSFSTFDTGSYSLNLTAGTAGCSYTVAPTSQAVAAAGGTGSVSVTTSNTCLWTALSDSDWVTITSGGNTTGTGTVNYTVAANPTTNPRNGMLIVAGQTVAISQLGSSSTCLVTPINFGQTVNGTISSGDCTSVVRGSSYLADRYSFSGTAGNGVAIISSSSDINLNLQLIGPNGLVLLGNSSRLPSSGFFNLPTTGMYILEVTSFSTFDTGSYSLNLSVGTAGCSYSVAPISQAVAAAGGTASVNVTTSNTCLWTVVSDSDWITITSGSSATGAGAVNYTVAPNASANPRNGMLIVAEQTVTISQLGSAGTCLVTPAGIGQIVNGTISSSDCTSVVRGSSYLADRYSFSGTAGNGVAIIGSSPDINLNLQLIGPNGLALLGNSSRLPSSGFFSLLATGAYILEVTSFSTFDTGSYSVVLTTGTAGCSYSLSTTSQAVAATSGTGSVSVTTNSTCLWTALSDADWITITSGGNTTGTGMVNYSAAANLTTNPRSGNLFVAGQIVTISQLGDGRTCLVTPTSIGQIENGTISSGDCTSVVRGNSYLADRYSFSGTAGNGLAIIGSSPDINLNLQLIGPNGLVVTGNSSRLPSGGFFSLPATGMYILEVTSFSTFDTGSYSVILNAGTAGCSYTVTPANQSAAASGGTGSVSVGTGSVCLWMATSDSTWITVTSASSITGTGMVSYTVAPNTGVGPRSGRLTVAGQTVTITQLADTSICLVTPLTVGQTMSGTISSSDCTSVARGSSFYADRYSFNGVAGSAVAISLPSVNFDSYLYLIAPDGTAIAEADPPRIPDTGVRTLPASGTYIIEVTSFSSFGTGSYTLSLDVCNYTISPTNQSFSLNGGNGTISIGTTSGCAWTASTTATWITIASSSGNGSGNGSVSYTVGANGGAPRTGTITVAGQTFMVTQAGNNPVPAISALNPPSATAGDPALMLTVNGVNFISNSVVKWNGNDRPTTFTSATQLTATIPATDIAVPGTASLTVFNPTPGGGTSSPLSFTINPNPRVVRVVAATGAPGGTIAVPIELAAQGSENSLGFSLTFDPSILGNPQAALGSDATGGSVNTNPSQTAQGRLGLILSLPAGQQFSAGARQIAVVTFAVAAGATTATTNVGFGDQPVPREVVDVMANTLAANYLPGAITIAQGYEADVTPTPNGNGAVTVSDWVRIGRFATGLETPAAGSEFQRADCAPRTSLGDGRISLSDYVQAGRYAAGLDPLTPAGGPATPASSLARADLQHGKNPRTMASRLRLVQAEDGALALELDAQGVENAMAFSLRFDPAAWRLAAADLGVDAREATLQLNLGDAERGRIGIVLALPAGRTFAAGGRQIVKLRFAPLAASGTLSRISFADQPVARELVDVAADVLPASYAVRIGAMEARTVAVVSAASFAGEELARGSIVAAFGENLATDARIASTLPLPVELGGARVTIADSSGVEHSAPLFFVAPGQINFLLPEDAAPGWASIQISSSDGSLSLGLIQITDVAPSLFAANADGQGAAAGVVVRVKADGSQQLEPLAEFDTAQGRYVARALAFDEDEEAYLALFGSGLRFHTSTAVSVRFGEIEAPVLYAGPQGEFAGLDQVNVQLPRALRGRGEVDLSLAVDGKEANTIRIHLRQAKP